MGAASRRDARLISRYSENSHIEELSRLARCIQKHEVQPFQRMQRKPNATGRKCLTCKRSDHFAAECPSRLGVVEKWQDEDGGAHDKAFTEAERIETTRPESSEKEGLEYVLG